jgi:hypothetical protein
MQIYDTVSEALNDLKNRGFINDFNLQPEGFHCPDLQRVYQARQLLIRETYRFEGDSDPADEAVVYALQADDGVQGTFVNGYGTYADTVSETILLGLRYR